MDDLDNLPAAEWLISGVLPAGGLAVLFGEPGGGKSFLAIGWALSIAAGVPWLGRNVKAGCVIYVYAEGATGLKSRIVAWRMVHEGGDLGDVRFLADPLSVRDEDQVSELVEVIRTECQPVLIVIDTLARTFGEGDENAPKDMNGYVAGVDELRRAFPGTAVLIVHHSGKDPKRGDRGHSSLRAAADTMIRLSKDKGALILRCEKQKDAEPFKDIRVRLRPVPSRSWLELGWRSLRVLQPE